MTAVTEFKYFKMLLDVNWPGIADGQPLQRFGTTIVSIPTPVQLGIDKEVWITLRTDGKPNTGAGACSGSQQDPFNGSTMALFDALMASFPVNTKIHLGPGLFRTSVTKTWLLQSGWEITGAGMYRTTVQLGGIAAGVRQVWCFGSTSVGGQVIDNVFIHDLTCDANWAELSITADPSAGEFNIKTGAIFISGGNNRFERVRSINTYGSFANSQEHFPFCIVSDGTKDSVNNVIDSCRAELPNGNYGAPVALFGTAPFLVRNSKVTNFWGIGINNGANGGFPTGGVNLALASGITQSGNIWIDCGTPAYHDTSTVDGWNITNETCIRCGSGVNLNGSNVAHSVTITIASPGVITWNNHGLYNGQSVVFTTTGALPTGLTAGTVYYVLSATTNTFEVSATPSGAAIVTSGTQSGTHTATAITQQNVNVKGCNFQIQNRAASGAVSFFLAPDKTVNDLVYSGNTCTIAQGGTGGGTVYTIFSGTNYNEIISLNVVPDSFPSNVTSGAKLFLNKTPSGLVPSGLTDN